MAMGKKSGAGPEVLFLIPARGGSKGIPDKNVAPLRGKPLIEWTIGLARGFAGTMVCVSTDSQSIAAVARRAGAEIIERPASLATDTAPMLPVIRHAIEAVRAKGGNPETIVLLQPTSPFRAREDVQGALEKFRAGGYDIVVAVAELSHPLEWTFWMGKDGELSPVSDSGLTRRQDAKKAYALNGAVYVFSARHALSAKSLLSGKIGACVMPRERSLDIDEPLDLRIAECLAPEPGK